MSHRKDKEAKRKAKLKAKKGVAEQNRLLLSKRIADAIMDLCVDVLPEYVDDSKGFDLAGRISLWRLGMTAWNIAVSGRKEIEKSSIDAMRLDDQSRKTLRDEINGFVRRKYEKYPGLRTQVANVAGLFIAGEARLKVTLGDTFPPMPIPDFDDKPEPLTPEQILAKRKELGLSQVKFAAALGVSVKKVSAWEHGKAVPDENVSKRILNLYKDQGEK